MRNRERHVKTWWICIACMMLLGLLGGCSKVDNDHIDADNETAYSWYDDSLDIPDDEIIKLFKDRKAAHICTISPALPFALFDREISGASEMAQYNGNIVFEGVIDCAKACLENGIPVGLGTDVGCPYITHYDMWRELNYFVKYCGVTNSFALHTATLINAQIAGIDNITGSIEKGKCADLIVTAGNPIEDIRALRNVDMVMSHGVLTENPVVKKMPEVETELDKFL